MDYDFSARLKALKLHCDFFGCITITVKGLSRDNMGEVIFKACLNFFSVSPYDFIGTHFYQLHPFRLVPQGNAKLPKEVSFFLQASAVGKHEFTIF